MILRKNYFAAACCFLFLISCTTFNKSSRTPSSAMESFLPESARTSFFIAQLPDDKRNRTVLSVDEFNDLSNQCLQADTNVDVKHKYAQLISKLNRPFYFVPLANQPDGIAFVGDKSHVQEFLCLSLATSDAKPGSVDYSSTIIQISQGANIDYHAIELLIGLWEKYPVSLSAGRAIINHPKLTVYDVKRMLGSLFKTKNATAIKGAWLLDLMATKAFAVYPKEFTTYFLGESTHILSDADRFWITSVLMSGKTGVDASTILEFALKSPDESQDYSGIYQKLSNARNPPDKFAIFKSMYHSDARVTHIDSFFQELWDNQPTPEIIDGLTKIAIAELISAKRLSHPLAYRTVSRRLLSAYPNNGLREILESGIHGQSELTVEEKVDLLKLVAKQTSLDTPTALSFLNTAESLRRMNPSIETDLGSSVTTVGQKFITNTDARSAYVRFISHTQDIKYKLQLSLDLMSITDRENEFLSQVIASTRESDPAIKYPFFDTLLTQKNLTGRFLTEITYAVSRGQNLNDEEKRIITTILNHPNADTTVKTAANKRLNPFKLEYINEIK